MIRYGRPDAHAHILVADEDPSFVSTLQRLLAGEGFRVTVADDGPSAIRRFMQDRPDLVLLGLLDVVAPGMTGFDVCRELRRHSQVPIVLLAQHDTEVDWVLGLEMGADASVTKDCGERELIARLRAALRRGPHAPTPSSVVLVDAGVELDPERHDVRVNGKRIDLSVKEFELLRLLLVNKGKVVPRRKLLAEIWGFGSVSGGSTSLETHVRRLRAKLETDPDAPRRIVSVRGIGYKFEAEAEAEDPAPLWSSATA